MTLKTVSPTADEYKEYFEFVAHLNTVTINDLEGAVTYVRSYFNDYLAKKDTPGHNLAYLKYNIVLTKFGPILLEWAEDTVKIIKESGK